MKIFNRPQNVVKNYFKKKVTKHDLQAYKIIMSHVYNKNSVLLADPKFNEYIITNKKTHYDLILNFRKAILVNTKDVIDLEINVELLDRVNSKVRDLISAQRQDLKHTILGRKSGILDKILLNVKK